MPSEVRILPSPPRNICPESGNSSVGRARAFQARGRGFESRFPLHASLTARRRDRQWTRAHVAQSAEHFLGKEEVTGSIPVVGFQILAAARRAVRTGLRGDAR